MTSGEIKQAYYLAKKNHEKFHDEYLYGLKKAKECFENNDADGMKLYLGYCETMLEAAANFRAEMDVHERELIRRRCSY